MDAATKKRLFLSVIFATLAEVSIFLFIFMHNIFTIATWRIMIGSVVIISGVTFIYNIALLPFLKEKDKILKYAMIASTGITMIFTGIGILFWDQKRFFVFFLICGLGAVISFLIGVVLLQFHLFKKE